MKQQFDKQTFTMPTYLMSWLDHVSVSTGYSKSNLVMQALSQHLHRFEATGTPENTLCTIGRKKGYFDEFEPEYADL
ncbi:hypothetical protein AB4876_05565 [Zhongshania guokunii]|uniref:CopG family transcriptional regulator n=1 Tax=Zhongshania guokunii TaxID=641783 RepID=A0ABV3U4C5_9GAMM